MLLGNPGWHDAVVALIVFGGRDIAALWRDARGPG